MKHAIELDGRAGLRLIQLIRDTIADEGVTGRLRAAVNGAEGTVTLPPVDLFTPGGKVRPVTWMVGQPPLDEETLIYAYEVFVEQPLGVTPRPGLVAEEVLQEAYGTKYGQMLGGRWDARYWYTAAARLVALAQLVPGARVAAGPQGLSATLSQGRLEVSPDGVYSNIKGQVLPALAPPRDALVARQELEELEVDDKLIVGLARLLNRRRDMPEALRGLAECFRVGVMTSEHAQRLLVQPRKNSPELKSIDPVGDAFNLLGADRPDIVAALKEVLVPGLFGSREFQRLFGDAKYDLGRRPRESTRQRWAELIVARASATH